MQPLLIPTIRRVDVKDQDLPKPLKRKICQDGLDDFHNLKRWLMDDKMELETKIDELLAEKMQQAKKMEELQTRVDELLAEKMHQAKEIEELQFEKAKNLKIFKAKIRAKLEEFEEKCKNNLAESEDNWREWRNRAIDCEANWRELQNYATACEENCQEWQNYATAREANCQEWQIYATACEAKITEEKNSSRPWRRDVRHR
jgi:predicted nuclease with TOPRIM domain